MSTVKSLHELLIYTHEYFKHTGFIYLVVSDHFYMYMCLLQHFHVHFCVWISKKKLNPFLSNIPLYDGADLHFCSS